MWPVAKQWSARRDHEMGKFSREACAEHDPDHPQKRIRRNWGSGPTWTQGAASWFDRAGSRR